MASRPSSAPGVYEDLITHAVEQALNFLESRGHHVQRSRQDLSWVDQELARHVASLVERALADIGAGSQAMERRVALVTRVLQALEVGSKGIVELPDDLPTATRDALTWISPPHPAVAPVAPARPEHGLLAPAFLFNGRGDVSLLHELIAELDSADRVDAVVAFLKTSGLNLLKPALRRFFDRGGQLRLITTTYTGATEARAVVALNGLGGRVRVSYEDGRTRLHAKAWLFHRSSGLCTAYVGSSNLSHAALTDGDEWNVRLTRRQTPAVVERFEQAFEQMWDGLERDFDVERDGDRLVHALAPRTSTSPGLPAFLIGMTFRPKPHQEEALDALAAERDRGHWSNLVVSATGTGKTWIAAFDFARLRSEGIATTLLFVAHRKEILTQARDVFRAVLQDPDFGQLWVDGQRPTRLHAVFASVQSLRADLVRSLPADAVQMLIIDEFHHAAAPSYTALLEHLKPAVRLGLTATPERMDGRSVLHWFDQRTATEIRLWDALEAGLLCPFHYYGVFDATSAETAWKRGRLQPGELDSLYSGDDVRARRVLEAVGRYVPAPDRMRALGFCVGIGHAERMARTFNEAGVPAVALHSQSPDGLRGLAVQQLRRGDLRVVFTVDLFNEGVDLPEVDTVLFLRPTESATVFLQQLGRGLRHAPNKAQLLVLDFVGHVHADYRYDVRYRALLGGTTAEVLEQVQRDFPRLPPGCAIQLESAARDEVLASVKRFVGASGKKRLIEELRQLPPDTSLATFLDRAACDVTDVFVPQRGQSWSSLRRAAGHERRDLLPDEDALAKRIGRMLHVDDLERLDAWRTWLDRPTPPRLRDLHPRDQALLRMLLVSVGDGTVAVADFQQELDRVWSFAATRHEATELLDVLRDQVRHTARPLDQGPVPLALHGTYSRREVIAALDVVAKGRLRTHREGPLWVPEHALDVFFVTLEKAEDRFRPSVRYADYPISATRFHWESQNSTHDATPTGQRYVEHAARGSSVVFMVRERSRDERGESLPFVCLGPATYESHRGARPMQMTWRLHHAMPARLLQVGRAVAP